MKIIIQCPRCETKMDADPGMAVSICLTNIHKAVKAHGIGVAEVTQDGGPKAFTYRKERHNGRNGKQT